MTTLRPLSLILTLIAALALTGCKGKEEAAAPTSALAPTLDSKGEVMALLEKKQYEACVEALSKLREKVTSPSTEAEFTALSREVMTQLRMVSGSDESAKTAFRSLSQLGAGR